MTTTAPTLFDPGLPDPSRPHVTVRHDAPETSRGAGRLAWPKSGTQRAEVLDWIARSDAAEEPLRRGLTDHQLVDLTGLPINVINPRRSELVRDGWVEGNAAHQRDYFGHRGIVWTLSDAGRKEWHG